MVNWQKPLKGMVWELGEIVIGEGHRRKVRVEENRYGWVGLWQEHHKHVLKLQYRERLDRGDM